MCVKYSHASYVILGRVSAVLVVGRATQEGDLRGEMNAKLRAEPCAG